LLPLGLIFGEKLRKIITGRFLLSRNFAIKIGS
jgi:hypothetical protein